MARRRSTSSTSSTEPEQVETENETPAQPEGQSEEPEVTTEAQAVEPTEQDATESVESETSESAAQGDSAEGAASTASAEPEGDKEAESDPVAEVMEYAKQVVSERDPQTATLAKAAVETFKGRYGSLDGAQKRAVRAAITAEITRLLDDDNDETSFESMLGAKAYNELLAETKKSATTKAPAVKADPTEAYVDRYMSIALAGMALPIDTDVNREKANESISALVGRYNTAGSPENLAFARYLEWARAEDKEKRGDEPEVPEFVKAAVKIADGKAAGRVARRASSTRSSGGGGRVGGGRDIAKHVTEAMAEHPVGEFVSIADIANFKSSEYTDSKPSSGAISARLFPASGGKSTILNIEGVPAEASPSGKKGAKRVA